MLILVKSFWATIWLSGFVLLEHISSAHGGPDGRGARVQKQHMCQETCHANALQEAIDYLQHECLTNHFYITHVAGCAVMFNKDTFQSDITVKSIYLHDNRNGVHQTVREGQSAWVLQDVISRASFQRIPRNGKSYFTMMSLHINYNFAKMRGQSVLQCYKSKSTWWLVTSMVPHGANRAVILDPSALLEKRWSIRTYLCHPAPHRCGGPGGVPGEWSDVCGFLEPEPSQSLSACWVSRKKVKVAITKFGSSLGWLIVYHETTNLTDQIRERGTHLTATARKEGRIVGT